MYSASHNHLASIRNLIGKQWLSDDILDNVFDLMNRTHDDTICFVCKPTQILYLSAGLHDKMHRIRSSGVTLSRVIVAINVGCDSDGAYYISDERRQGVHWAVLIIELHCGKTYLWGLTWLASTKQFNRNGWCKLEKTGGRPWDKYYYFTSRFYYHKQIVLLYAGNSGFDLHKCFYPLQSCSHMCGVIVVCMVAVICDHWNSWFTWGSCVDVLSNPSMNSRQLRLIVMSWIVDKKVNTSVFVPKKLLTHTTHLKLDTTYASGKINRKKGRVNVCEDNTKSNACTSHTMVTMKEAKLNNDTADSDDDFVPTNKASKLSPVKSNDSDSDDDIMKSEIRRSLILGMLPDGYTGGNQKF